MSKNKLIKHLIKHLENDIYCRIGVSKLHGVGVIAIRDIPKGVNPFKNLSPLKDKIITLDDNDLKNLNKDVKKLVDDFFGHKYGYDVLYYGPNYINISYYLNHSNKPNLDMILDKTNKTDYFEFITNKKIKKGDELLINYNMYD